MYLSIVILAITNLIQVIVLERIMTTASDYKIQVPNINTRFWQTPLRESVYQSIARHRVYRGENLDERQEYDRMLWSKIRVARFMKRLDVIDASEGLKTGVLVNDKRGEYEFRQTDHSIYDCVGRKCRSDNVLLAVWRVQQMNEPYTLYISVKIPNYQLYHFEPTEDVYLFTVEKGLKRLRYQQNNTKKSTGKLIYDPYPFVSSRFNTQSTPIAQTFYTSVPEVITDETSPIQIVFKENENLDYRAKNDTRKISRPRTRTRNDYDQTTYPYERNQEEFYYSQRANLDSKPTFLEPESNERRFSPQEDRRGSGVRRTFNILMDTSPYWKLDILSPPSQYKNYSNIHEDRGWINFDSRKTTSIPRYLPEVIITPKPFKPSTQFHTYSEPDPMYHSENFQNQNPLENQKKATQLPVIIVDSFPEPAKDIMKTTESSFFQTDDTKINYSNLNHVANQTKREENSFEYAPKNSQKLSFLQGRNTSSWRTRPSNKRKSNARKKNNNKNKNSDSEIGSNQRVEQIKNPHMIRDSFENLKYRYLRPTTYHPQLNVLVPSESKQYQIHLLPDGGEVDTPNKADESTLKCNDEIKYVDKEENNKKSYAEKSELIVKTGDEDFYELDDDSGSTFNEFLNYYQDSDDDIAINMESNDTMKETNNLEEIIESTTEYPENSEIKDVNFSALEVTESPDSFYLIDGNEDDRTELTTVDTIENINYIPVNNLKSFETNKTTDEKNQVDFPALKSKRENEVNETESLKDAEIKFERKFDSERPNDSIQNNEKFIDSHTKYDETLITIKNGNENETDADQDSKIKAAERNISAEINKSILKNESNSSNLSVYFTTKEGQNLTQKSEDSIANLNKSADSNRKSTDIAERGDRPKSNDISVPAPGHKNHTISVVVSRLTKSISQRLHNETLIHVSDSPIYKKKIMKKLKI